MKSYRCIIWLITLFPSMQAVAQDANNNIFTYIIQRGEDIETVAARHGTTADELRKRNPGLDVFFSGMEIKVPKAAASGNISYGMPPHAGNAHASAIRLTATSPHGKLLAEAQKEQTDGNYKKAAKLYSKIIENHKGGTDWNIYLARGYCQYQRGKYKSAIEDIEAVLNDEQCSGSDRDMVSGFLEDAQAKREEQLSRRGELWGEIIGTTALIGANVYAASQSAKAQGNSAGTWTVAQRKNLGSMSDTEFNAYINQSMQQIWQQTQLQVKTQFAQEKAQVDNNFIQTYRQLNGRDPSEWEIQQNYNSYMQTRINAANAVSEASAYSNSDFGENQNGSSSGTPETTITKHECSMCHGTGRIGKEFNPPSYDGNPDNTKVKCEECGGIFLKSSGHAHVPCPVCHGKKYL